jgi:hypothetical protein
MATTESGTRECEEKLDSDSTRYKVNVPSVLSEHGLANFYYVCCVVVSAMSDNWLGRLNSLRIVSHTIHSKMGFLLTIPKFAT